MIVILLTAVVISSSGCSNAVNCNQSANAFTSISTQLDSTYSIKYIQAYYQGMQEALEEIKKDSMTFYEYGEGADYPYNVETGLSAKMVAGCIINDSIAGRVEGHNATIKNYVKSLVSDDEINKATNHLDTTITVEYRNAYYRGMQEAYNEIKNNKITRYVYGKGNWSDKDKETGVIIKVIAGCIVSDAILGRADGHNYIILKYLNHEIK